MRKDCVFPSDVTCVAELAVKGESGGRMVRFPGFPVIILVTAETFTGQVQKPSVLMTVYTIQGVMGSE